MWALETVNGPRLVASLVPAPHLHPYLDEPPSKDDRGRPPSDSDGHRWRAEVVVEWPPYAHTIATVVLPSADRRKAKNGSAAGTGWALLMLSLKDDRPPIFSAAPSMGVRTSSAARAWQESWEDAAVAASTGGCWYSSAAVGQFLFGCDGDAREGGGSVLLAGEGPDGEDVERCGMVHSELAAAAAACSKRKTCGGVTLVPGWGFELRSSTTLGGFVFFNVL